MGEQSDRRGFFISRFLYGLRTAGVTPCLVLFSGALGFGALARDLDFSIGQAAFMTAAFFALPAQVLLVDQLARGVPFIAAAFAVSLTGIRLLPMTVTLMPYLKGETAPRWMRLAIVHVIAVTVWVAGTKRLPALAEDERVPVFLGIGMGLVAATVLGTIAGHVVAGLVPVYISAALLFLTPNYFIMSMIEAVRLRRDALAILFGIFLGPVLFVLAPGFDLLLAGLIGGSAAYAIGRRLDERA